MILYHTVSVFNITYLTGSINLGEICTGILAHTSPNYFTALVQQ